jgi:hypothetical protein
MKDACEASNSNVDLNQLQGRKCTCNVTLKRVRATIFGVKKQCVTYSECLPVALGTQHGMRMRRIVIYALSGSTIFFHIIS